MTMLPIDTLPADARRNLRGVVFDIDDTITDDGRVGLAAYEALWALADAGLALVAVTGRPLGWCDVIARLFPLTAAVGENGAGWVWRAQDRGLREAYWDPAPVRTAQRAQAEALARAVKQQLPHVTLAEDQPLRRVDLAFDVAERVRLPATDVTAIVDLARAAGARALVSSVHVHVFFGDHDKARGVVRAVADACGEDVAADPARWLFVGDSGNDAAAFAYFPISAGVANVREHLGRLSVPPAYVSREPRGRGFAEIARVVLDR